MKTEVIKLGDGYSVRAHGRELVYIKDGADTLEVIDAVIGFCDYSAGFQAGKLYSRQQTLERLDKVSQKIDIALG